MLGRAVIDYSAPSSIRALEEFQKEELRDHLVKFATWRCGSEPTAKDLVAEAMLLVCDPAAKPWDPQKGPFTRHMRMLVEDVWIRRHRSGYGRREAPEDGLVMDETTLSPARPVDEELHERRQEAWMREMGERTVALIEKKYPYARRLSELLPKGVEKPADLAQELGCPVETVYDTLEALKRYGRKVYAEWEASERKRMRQLRAQAKEREVTR